MCTACSLHMDKTTSGAITVQQNINNWLQNIVAVARKWSISLDISGLELCCTHVDRH